MTFQAPYLPSLARAVHAIQDATEGAIHWTAFFEDYEESEP